MEIVALLVLVVLGVCGWGLWTLRRRNPRGTLVDGRGHRSLDGKGDPPVQREGRSYGAGGNL